MPAGRIASKRGLKFVRATAYSPSSGRTSRPASEPPSADQAAAGGVGDDTRDGPFGVRFPSGGEHAPVARPAMPNPAERRNRLLSIVTAQVWRDRHGVRRRKAVLGEKRPAEADT